MKRKHVHWGLICFLTYLTAYLCRVNFSASLTSLSAALSLDYDLLGTAGAAFFFVYAVGQLINGFLGDHFHPVRFILTALVGTAFCNIGVAFAHTYPLILLLWAANGYFQSIFWSTMIRLLSMVTAESERGSISSLISSAMPAGYLISWCVLAPCFSDRNVMLFFLFPALIALPAMLLWRGTSEHLPEGHAAALTVSGLRAGVRKTFGVVRRERLTLILFVLICHGLIKEGIAFWIPTIIRGASGSAAVTAAALALLPAANFAGTRAAKGLLRRWSETPLRIVRLMYCLILPLSALCLFDLGLFILIPMCLLSAFCYCSNTVLLSYVPMRYRAEGVVSSLVGLFDFCSYIGAAVSTYVLGGIISDYGAQRMALVWIIAGCIGMALLLLNQRRSKTNG